MSDEDSKGGNSVISHLSLLSEMLIPETIFSYALCRCTCGGSCLLLVLNKVMNKYFPLFLISSQAND